MTLEREVKLTASPGFRLPDLSGLVPDCTSGQPDTRRLFTSYFDTSDLRLARWGCSLRYRTGEGWTVKLPAAGEEGVLARLEHRFEGRARRPPEEAVDLLRAYIRGARLGPVASLRTVRRRVELRDGAEQVVAEVVDDEVSVMEGRRVARRFREVEVEARDGARPDLLLELSGRLREAGAGEPDLTPKYVRALGPKAFQPADVTVDSLSAGALASEVVRAALSASVIRLIRHDPGLRIGSDPEDAHQARVATRRLRSDLRTFGGFLDPGWATQTREELRWVGGLLGAVRDAEVLAGRLKARLIEIPTVRAAEHLLDRLGERRAEARVELLEALRQERYVRLLDRLVEGAGTPPVLPSAASPAEAVLAPLVVEPWKKLRSAARSAGDHSTAEDLHRVRIRAKRARYAAEAVAPVLGRKAAAFARAAARLQDVLGEHQDAVVAETWLREAATEAGAPGAFAAGQLAALEWMAAADARRAWPAAWKAVRRARPTSWA